LDKTGGTHTGKRVTKSG